MASSRDLGCMIFGTLFWSFTIIFMVCGITLISVSIWVSLDQTQLREIDINHLLRAATALLLLVGIVILAAGIVGNMALWQEERRYLHIFVGMLIVITVVQMIAGILAAVFKVQTAGILSDNLFAKIRQSYSLDNFYTTFWDQTQIVFRCCGFHGGPGDWKQTGWMTSSARGSAPVPKSCCLRERNSNGEVYYKNVNLCHLAVTNPDSYKYHTFVNWTPCYAVTRGWADARAVAYMGLAFGLIPVYMFGFLVAYCLLREVLNNV